jgi:hypothetical protein
MAKKSKKKTSLIKRVVKAAKSAVKKAKKAVKKVTPNKKATKAKRGRY